MEEKIILDQTKNRQEKCEKSFGRFYMKLLNIIFAFAVLCIVALFIIYGTISPCGILKKEIANQAHAKSEQGLYLLFGGFIERGVDTLTPLQCVAGVYKIKTEGIDKTMNDLLR